MRMNRFAALSLSIATISIDGFACDSSPDDDDESQQRLAIEAPAFDGPLVPPYEPPQNGSAGVTVVDSSTLSSPDE